MANRDAGACRNLRARTVPRGIASQKAYEEATCGNPCKLLTDVLLLSDPL